MRLTTKGRFAVTAMIDLALREHTGPVALAAISGRQQISLSSHVSRLRRRQPSALQSVVPLLAAVGQILFLDGKDVARFDVDLAHQAYPAGNILEPRVIDAGADAGDAQSLIGIDRAVLVVLALVLAPFFGSGGRELEFGDGMARQVPKPHRLLGGERA